MSAGQSSNDGQQTAMLTENATNEIVQSGHLILRLRTDRPRVTFTADTIDNEHLGRLKSNCCCIYVKPRQWDDPSTWENDEAETEHCRGHTLPDQKPPENDKNVE
ncbi:Protein phosphatase inhibitor [Aphelenchoides besseyi]|nr:Protein phosphatase inhibitor [Aphelenchoides besseyi]KAI6227105.1 Protein phosphatase inhibitor [Aphelenchoides besseyi]